MIVLCEPKHVGAAFIILTILIIRGFYICVHYLDNKVVIYVTLFRFLGVKLGFSHCGPTEFC